MSYVSLLEVSAGCCYFRFHVDDMSSAHVYLRLPEGSGIDDIPADTLEDCAQLVKQNSIQGEFVTYATSQLGAGWVIQHTVDTLEDVRSR
jgi:hypothetical protein